MDEISLLGSPEEIGELKPPETYPTTLSILPLRGIIIFPFQILPVMIIRSSSIRLIDEAVLKDKLVGVVAQKDAEEETPNVEGLYKFGTICRVLRMLKFPDNSMRILLQGLARMKIEEFITDSPFFKAKISIQNDIVEESVELSALARNVSNLFQRMLSHLPQFSEELQILIMNIKEPERLADFVAANLNISTAEKQELLELLDVRRRFEKILVYLNKELEVLELSSKIQSEVKSSLDKKQREFFLRQELEAIKKELGEADELTMEINELKTKIKEAKMSEEVEKVAFKELNRLAKMQPGFAEYTVSRTYLDWLISLPWNISTEDNLDIKKAKEILDEDHYGLEKIKERIIEYLAVRSLKKDSKGPILCFIGPPGVGKTSLGKSIARALGRKFVRISLGGVHDESEIRGHRRTYVGALPGRIIQGIKNAASNNPVFMLDEIDKLGADFRGDPSAALLEVLDPEQNNAFVDHYLDVPFDLSKVMFITTGNILDTIPPALLDRMEVLRLPGYTLEEKIQIGSKYLVPRQLAEHGLTPANLEFTEPALKKIVTDYTREAGLRNFEREIANICRKVATKIAETGKPQSVKITENNIEEFLGAARFFPEVAERINQPGIATGLAWTQAGGSLIFIEATKMPGTPKLVLTGQLGDVMKESASIALSYLRANAKKYNIPATAFKNTEIHIHIPEGATPKDGPSAGITIVTALFSLFKNKKVRSDVAMTGEITLRGKILPVGGIKEKVISAKEAGIANIILPDKNKKELEEIPENIKQSLKFNFFNNIDNVIKFAIE